MDQLSAIKSLSLKFIITFFISFYFFQLAVAQGDTIAFSSPKEQAVRDLIKRVLPKHADHFIARLIPKEEEKDFFEIESRNGKIILGGNNGISIASALHYYLKNFANCQITWNGTNLNLPKTLLFHLPIAIPNL